MFDVLCDDVCCVCVVRVLVYAFGLSVVVCFVCDGDVTSHVL